MTLFEKIIAREIPAKIIHEDDNCIAFYDIQPVAPVHVLVVPKKPLPSIAEMEDKDIGLLGQLMYVAKTLAQQLGIAEDGYRLVINTKSNGGQSVDHLHIHLLGGRKLSWPPG